MKKYILNVTLICFSLVLLQSCSLLSSAGLTSKGLPTAEAPDDLTSSTANSAVNVDHSTWDKLLKKHVDNKGLVNYKGFKEDRQQLDSYLNMLSSQEPTKDWSVQEQLAYYINLYNAFTIDLILRNYPVESIQDINNAFTEGFIKVGDTNISLGGVENSILRKMNEPRIHFAISCASMSCPKLLNEAYTASKINEQLEMVTTEFINSDKNEISQNQPKVSSLFDWYKKDFKEYGTVSDYINHYSKNTDINSAATLTFKKYDWALNEQK